MLHILVRCIICNPSAYVVHGHLNWSFYVEILKYVMSPFDMLKFTTNLNVTLWFIISQQVHIWSYNIITYLDNIHTASNSISLNTDTV